MVVRSAKKNKRTQHTYLAIAISFVFVVNFWSPSIANSSKQNKLSLLWKKEKIEITTTTMATTAVSSECAE